MSVWRQCLAHLPFGKKTHKTPTAQLGCTGEDVAAQHITGLGYTIVARNWRYKQLELDIVCYDGATLVFVEVKTRSGGAMTSPTDAINARKRHALMRAATAWLSVHEAWHRPCRFDVVGVVRHTTKNETTFSVEHYPHAFDFSQAVGGSHTSWQPW